MKGTEKQIKWAEDIIAEAYANLECMDRNIDRLGNMAGYDRETVAKYRAVLDKFVADTDSAAVIIDKRWKLTNGALRRMAEEEYMIRARRNRRGY